MNAPPTAPPPPHSSGTTALPFDDIDALKRTLAGTTAAKFDRLTNNRVLRALGRGGGGDLDAMEAYFAAMPEHDVGSFGSVVSALARAGQPNRAADYLERLLAFKPGAPVALPVFISVVQAHAERPGLAGGERLLELLRRSGFRVTDRVVHRLGDQARYFDSVDAKERYLLLLHGFGFPLSLPVLNMLMDASAKAGNVARAEFFFKRIRPAGAQPCAASFGSLIDVYRRTQQFERCFEVEQEMRSSGVAPSATTYTLLIVAAGGARQPARVRALLLECLQTQPSGSSFAVFNAAVSAAAQGGDFDGAREYLAEMLRRGVRPTVRLLVSLGGVLVNQSPHESAGRRLLQTASPDRARLSSAELQRVLTAADIAVVEDVLAELAGLRWTAVRSG